MGLDALDRPEFWVAATLGFWVLSQKISARFPRIPILNPVLICLVFLSVTLLALGVDFKVYYRGTQWLHWLLGPATVALAFPLYRQWHIVRQNVVAVVVALGVGCVWSLFVVFVLGKWGGLSDASLLACMTKSVSTPIALATARDFGSDPALAVLMVVVSGLFGATLGFSLLTWVGVKDPRARGFAIGLASHGLGAAVAFQKNEAKGAWAGLAMVLNGVLTPIVLPLLWHLLG